MPDDRYPKGASGGPRVSVVMAAYNGDRYIASAIDSILGQTLADFEFIIVDDGSSDATPDILGRYDDPRLRIIRNAVNQGQAAALNRGLEAATGAYIARMDADDEAVAERLEKQVAYLETHPEIGILGTGCQNFISQEVVGSPTVFPSGGLAIRWRALIANPFAHPTVMLRRSLLETYGFRYDETLLAAQDYELWSRMLKVTMGANLTEPLLHYRRDSTSVTDRHRREQLSIHDHVVYRALGKQFPELRVNEEEATGLRRVFAGGDEDLEEFDVLVLTTLYLNIWKTFAANHRGEEGLVAARRDAALRGAEALRHSKLGLRWFREIARILMMDPALPIRRRRNKSVRNGN